MDPNTAQNNHSNKSLATQQEKSIASPGPSSLQATNPRESKPTMPISASDDDNIEIEWVQKCQKIFSDYHGDPFEQSRHVSLLKAQYIKMRYGKEIRVDE